MALKSINSKRHELNETYLWLERRDETSLHLPFMQICRKLFREKRGETCVGDHSLHLRDYTPDQHTLNELLGFKYKFYMEHVS